MASCVLILAFCVIVATLLVVSHQSAGQRVFRWLPLPLWCYALPLLAVSLGWLPAGHPIYRTVTGTLLPFALALLVLGVDLPAVARVGWPALAAAVGGAAGIMLGGILSARCLQSWLPPEAWRGVGALVGTWTGGTGNLLALRTVLDIPETMFAPLIVVDALTAYTWMALLVALSGWQRPIDRWLRADGSGLGAQGSGQEHRTSNPASARQRTGPLLGCVGLSGGLVMAAQIVGRQLPTNAILGSASAWTIMLVTTAALAASLAGPIRRLGASGPTVGYPCLYLVLAATGAQADLRAFTAAPVWLLAGLGIVLTHGLVLLGLGRLLRIPLGLLATASQANLGGVVSAPLVGAVYHRSLASVGLLLAMAGNAVGTYLGWLAAVVSQKT